MDIYACQVLQKSVDVFNHTDRQMPNGIAKTDNLLCSFEKSNYFCYDVTIFKNIKSYWWSLPDTMVDTFFLKVSRNPVSYTHLDVYKRQVLEFAHNLTA